MLAFSAAGTIAALAAGAALDEERLGAALLLGGVYLAGLGVGALFFLALQTVTGARWSDSFRDVPARLTSVLPAAGFLLLLVLLALPDVYPWLTHPQSGLRQYWLTAPAFVARSAAYLGTWIVFARLSRRRPGSVPVAAKFLVLGTLTTWLAATDWLMSLTPAWTSTVFGIYALLGFVSSAIAAILIACVIGRHDVAGRTWLAENQQRDLGTMLFAANSLWMYLWYCQYMLIWYTDQAHESVYYALRTSNGWEWPFFATVVFHFVLPFALLLSRAVKRHRLAVSVAAISTLVGHWLDLYLQIVPAIDPDRPLPGPMELGIALGGVSYCVWILRNRRSRHLDAPSPGPRST